MTLNKMEKYGKQGTAFVKISDSMGKHGEHGNPFFMSQIGYQGKKKEAWDPCAAVFA